MRIIYSQISVILLLVGYGTDLYATHIRAGEITARLVSCQSLTYEFIITGYEDTGSDVEFGNGEIYFGFDDPVKLSNDVFSTFNFNGPPEGYPRFLENMKFIYLDPNQGSRQLKGWVHVFYNDLGF